jgi:hypothetical protein
VDPLLVTAMTGVLVAFAALAIYAFRGPQSGVARGARPEAGAATGQPEITLLPPKDRYTFKWDPTKAMYFDIQREGHPMPAGNWSWPGLILHNSSSVPAADAVVNWRSEITGVKELGKMGVLSKYEINFEDYAFMLVAKPGSGVPNFRYRMSDTFETKLPFIAKDSELFLPESIMSVLALFVTAKMPEPLGAKTDAFPVWLAVSWNVPYGGEPREFRVKIRGVNTKPSGIAGPPEIGGYLDFEIEKIK